MLKPLSMSLPQLGQNWAVSENCRPQYKHSLAIGVHLIFPLLSTRTVSWDGEHPLLAIQFSSCLPLEPTSSTKWVRELIFCLLSNQSKKNRSTVCRLVGSRNGAKTDGKAVPAIDSDDGQRQVHQFLLAQVLTHFFIDRVRHMPFGDQRHSFRPGQGGPLPLRIEGCFPPGVDGIEPLFAFAPGPRVFRMHVETVCAAV